MAMQQATRVREWTALDGQLVLQFALNDSPADGRPSIVTVTCKADPAGRQQLQVQVQVAVATRFALRFRTGCFVEGTLQQRARVHIDGVAHTAVFADIRFGEAAGAEQRFEGLMVSCPLAGQPVPPVPPAPPVPPLPEP
jgi:hypothetical protein